MKMKKASFFIVLMVVCALGAGAIYWRANAKLDTLQITNTQLQNQQATLQKAYDQCYEQLQIMADTTGTCEPIRHDNTPQSELEKIYEPETNSPDYQAKSDVLKKRYEELLVSYFVLKKCGLTGAADYHIILSALSHEMASINAPGRLQYDIITAAKGAYNELYANNECDERIRGTLHEEFRGYITALSDQFQF